MQDRHSPLPETRSIWIYKVSKRTNSDENSLAHSLLKAAQKRYNLIMGYWADRKNAIFGGVIGVAGVIVLGGLAFTGVAMANAAMHPTATHVEPTSPISTTPTPTPTETSAPVTVPTPNPQPTQSAAPATSSTAAPAAPADPATPADPGTITVQSGNGPVTIQAPNVGQAPQFVGTPSPAN
jgi:hypothetical protein